MAEQTLGGLPRHPLPTTVRRRRKSTLLVDGLVERSLVLSPSDLSDLPRREVEGDFRCEEGWQVPGLRWRGLPLARVVALAGPLPAARYVRVSAGDFTVPVTLAEAETALLCEELDGRSLGLRHGGPWRLLLPKKECFTSVKWVDRLELTAERGESTAERTARARLSR